MSTASKAIRQIRNELTMLSNEELESISWLRIDYPEPGPDREGARLQLRTRLAGGMLDERMGVSKADRKKWARTTFGVRPSELLNLPIGSNDR